MPKKFTSTAIKTKTEVSTGVALGIITVVAAAAAVAMIVNSGIGLPAAATASSQSKVVDLELKSVEAINLGNMTYSLTICNNGKSLNNYFKNSAQAALVLQWLTYNNKGVGAHYSKNLTAGEILNLSSGKCVILKEKISLTQLQKKEYQANAKIGFLVNPGFIVAEANKDNNAWACYKNQCRKTLVCKDSDNDVGLAPNYSLAGTARGFYLDAYGAATFGAKADACNAAGSKMLTEYSCTYVGVLPGGVFPYIVASAYKCPNGCKNGACIK